MSHASLLGTPLPARQRERSSAPSPYTPFQLKSRGSRKLLSSPLHLCRQAGLRTRLTLGPSVSLREPTCPKQIKLRRNDPSLRALTNEIAIVQQVTNPFESLSPSLVLGSSGRETQKLSAQWLIRHPRHCRQVQPSCRPRRLARPLRRRPRRRPPRLSCRVEKN